MGVFKIVDKKTGTINTEIFDRIIWYIKMKRLIKNKYRSWSRSGSI
jgi:hypothetical protein